MQSGIFTPNLQFDKLIQKIFCVNGFSVDDVRKYIHREKGAFFLYEYIMPSSNTKGKFVNTNYINFELFSLFIATILKMY